MTKYKFKPRSTFNNDLKKLLRLDRSIGEELKLAIEILTSGSELPPEYNDHKLQRAYSEYNEFHLRDTPRGFHPTELNDVVVIYKKDSTDLILIGVRIGSHNKLFKGKYKKNTK